MRLQNEKRLLTALFVVHTRSFARTFFGVPVIRQVFLFRSANQKTRSFIHDPQRYYHSPRTPL